MKRLLFVVVIILALFPTSLFAQDVWGWTTARNVPPEAVSLAWNYSGEPCNNYNTREMRFRVTTYQNDYVELYQEFPATAGLPYSMRTILSYYHISSWGKVNRYMQIGFYNSAHTLLTNNTEFFDDITGCILTTLNNKIAPANTAFVRFSTGIKCVIATCSTLYDFGWELTYAAQGTNASNNTMPLINPNYGFAPTPTPTITPTPTFCQGLSGLECVAKGSGLDDKYGNILLIAILLIVLVVVAAIVHIPPIIIGALLLIAIAGLTLGYWIATFLIVTIIVVGLILLLASIVGGRGGE